MKLCYVTSGVHGLVRTVLDIAPISSVPCIWTGTPPEEFLDLYDVLQRAQREQVKACLSGTPAEEIDRIGRKIISQEVESIFIHRTGHGIGVGHEDPYIVEGNKIPVRMGKRFSVEPEIYIPRVNGGQGLKI